MTIANLGLAIDSSKAVTAAADLDKLVISADKAEKGAAGVGRASQQMATALGSITAILTNIERHTSTMASGMGRASSSVNALGSSAGSATTNLRAMDAVASKVSSDLAGLTSSANTVSAAIQREATSVGVATAALRENTRAANENRSAQIARASGPAGGVSSSFNTANVAAQFQDIAVTSAMGMSPLQIALQQGTQLSAVLGGQGLTGVVRTLGAAFASVLSPVSLLTIGAVALGSMAIQSLGGIFQGAEDATDALKRHNEQLDAILVGYDDVRTAARDALDEALKAPTESVASDLGAKRAEAANAAVAAMQKALELKLRFEGELANAEFFSYAIPPETLTSLRSMNELIQASTADSALSREEIQALHVALTELGNNSSDEALKSTATSALDLIEAARQAFAVVDSLDTALRNIPRDVQIRLQVSQEFTSSMSDLGDLYMDPRSRFDVAREKASNMAEQASATAASYGDLVGVGKEYERVLTSIDAAEAASKAKSGARGAKSAAAAAAKPFNQWESATQDFQKRIEQQRMEADLLGDSTFEIERQKAAFDLLNQAKDAGIPITDSVTNQISSMSSEYAAATLQLERMTQAANDNAAIWNQAQDGVSGIIKTWARGGDVLAGISDRLLNIADMLVDMAVRDLFGAAFSGGGAGGGGGLFGWLGSLFGFANGGVFSGGNVQAFASGGVVSKPTMFPMATGMGLMGEAGPEAIMPLRRGPDGRLGVASANQNQQAVHVTVGVAADGNGNILPFVQSVSQQAVANSAPAIVGAARSGAAKDAPSAMARHQQQRAGSDYRTM